MTAHIRKKIVSLDSKKINKYAVEGRGRLSEEEMGKNENNNMKKKQEQS